MDKIHACKHPFFFPRNNFITVVKKIHFSLFKLSYKMSVNPQTPNERTDKIFDFSDFPFSRGKRKRGRWDCFPFRGKLAKNVTPPRVIRKWVIPRSFCLSARQKRHSVVVAFAGERESRAHLSRALNRVRMVARRPRYTIPSRFIIVTISNCWTLLPSLPSSIIVRIGETESASCLYD